MAVKRARRQCTKEANGFQQIDQIDQPRKGIAQFFARNRAVFIGELRAKSFLFIFQSYFIITVKRSP